MGLSGARPASRCRSQGVSCALETLGYSPWTSPQHLGDDGKLWGMTGLVGHHKDHHPLALTRTWGSHAWLFSGCCVGQDVHPLPELQSFKGRGVGEGFFSSPLGQEPPTPLGPRLLGLGHPGNPGGLPGSGRQD